MMFSHRLSGLAMHAIVPHAPYMPYSTEVPITDFEGRKQMYLDVFKCYVLIYIAFKFRYA